MIKKLRKEFIAIATVAVVSVMVLLCVIVNVANFVSVSARLDDTLDMISENKGKMTGFDRPDKPKDGRERRFPRAFSCSVIRRTAP